MRCKPQQNLCLRPCAFHVALLLGSEAEPAGFSQDQSDDSSFVYDSPHLQHINSKNTAHPELESEKPTIRIVTVRSFADAPSRNLADPFCQCRVDMLKMSWSLPDKSHQLETPHIPSWQKKGLKPCPCLFLEPRQNPHGFQLHGSGHDLSLAPSRRNGTPLESTALTAHSPHFPR